MMVDDEPLIRKIVMMEMNSRHVEVESGNEHGSVKRTVEMVDTFPDGPSLLAALDSSSYQLSATGYQLPDYILVDMEFQGEPTGGLAITRCLHVRYPQVKVIIFSGRFDGGTTARRINEIGSVVMEALRLGASAFVSKNAVGGFSIENILVAIASLERGEQFYFNYPVMLTLKEAAERYFRLTGATGTAEISDVERNLLLLEAAGCTASEISSRLGESDKAIQERQKDLSRRLDIVNKSAARVAKALSLGLISPEDVKFLPRQ